MNLVKVKETTVKETLTSATRRLTQAGCDTPKLDAEVLLAHTMAKDRTWLLTYPRHDLSEDQQTRFEELLNRREQREPVAYLTGRKEFFGLDFQVNRHVLIPRPETELLVETALQIAKRRMGDFAKEQNVKRTPLHAPRSTPAFSIVEVGTGSGCIAIALAKNLKQLSFFATDTSAAALHLARQNGVLHQVADKIAFIQGDLLEPLSRPVDLIVSNPPYLNHFEFISASVSPEVSRHEPQLALDGGEDGLDVIRELLAQANQKLAPGGSLLVEIGASQGRAVSQLARHYFPTSHVQIKTDLAGLDRLLVVDQFFG